MTGMTPADLVEIEQIRQLKYRYVRLIDQKRWDELGALFAPEATASYGDSMGDESMLTSHKVHQPEIALTGPDTATGVWALDDVVILGSLGLTVRGASFYDDRYVKVGGDWLIAHTGYKRIYEEIEPRSPDLKLTASWWGTDGRSSLL
jgi:hypothetical protein